MISRVEHRDSISLRQIWAPRRRHELGQICGPRIFKNTMRPDACRPHGPDHRLPVELTMFLSKRKASRSGMMDAHVWLWGIITRTLIQDAVQGTGTTLRAAHGLETNILHRVLKRIDAIGIVYPLVTLIVSNQSITSRVDVARNEFRVYERKRDETA